tara:strand:+ start:8279 stop:9907 length:1629 start_codon:yes stop_codon:yes gene_type:complete
MKFKKELFLKRAIVFLIIVSCMFVEKLNAQQISNTEKNSVTEVSISFLDGQNEIDPMIYGQMFENCNDRIIYDGVVNKDGSERPHVNELLKPLDVPVMRWPGGTYVRFYHWEDAIGPVDERIPRPDFAWGDSVNNRFGTDEFLQWCDKMNIAPYINFNMGPYLPNAGSLGEAIDWVEYVNGSEGTIFGQKRAINGHTEPYNVKYWCIGNENYLGLNKETAEEYSARLLRWSSTLKRLFPHIELLVVGHTYSWNEEVLKKNGKYVHFLTQHYYVNSMVKDDKLESPNKTLFSPAKMEAHIQLIGKQLDEYNKQNNRINDPIRFSIDEWNNRHKVFADGEYVFTRQDPRRQFDVAVTAGMLNVFIRQSPIVGMANYIFPVNGHGLIRTIGDHDAYVTPTYYVFEKYRNVMLGEKMLAKVNGDGLMSTDIKYSLAGDAGREEMNISSNKKLTFIDAAAVNNNGDINISLSNRSHTDNIEVKLILPEGYKPVEQWELVHPDINAKNTPENRTKIVPKTTKWEDVKNRKYVSVPPCGLIIIACKRSE